MTEETYSRPDMDRAIEAAFRLGFGNALAEVDGDGQVSGRPLPLDCATDCRDSGSRPETRGAWTMIDAVGALEAGRRRRGERTEHWRYDPWRTR